MSAVDGLRADIVWEANTGQAIADLGAVGDEYARTTGAMSDQALRLAAAQDRLTASIKRSGPESRAAKTATLAYREELAAVAKQADATSAAISRQAAAQARSAQVAAESQLKNQLAAARSVGHTLTTYVAAPTALVGAVAVKMAFDFESATRLIQTQAGATASEVERMRVGILDLVKSGDSFGQTATDMAKGLFAVESEGIRGAKALQILRVAAAGAAVGQTDLAETANALTSVMRVYGLDADQAAGAMATLNAAVGAGKLHMEDLNAALATKFLPTAKALGITLPQALAALDVFTRAGIPASVAANNLTTAFIKFESPTKAAATNLEQLGLSSTQLAADLQRGGLPAALADLVKGYDALERSQGKVAANQAIFGAFGGSRGGAPVLALVQQYQSYLQGLQQAQKQADPGKFWKQVAATMHEPAQKVHEDIARLSGDLIELGNKLVPIVADVVGGATKIIDAFNKLPQAAKLDLAVLVGILAVGGPLILGIAAVVRAINTIGKAFGRVPVKAGAAVAETDAELATLRTTAAETGAAAGASIETGVGAGVAGAETKVAALRLSLIGLGALAIAPIVIPIEAKLIGSAWKAIFGDSAFRGLTDAVPKPGSQNPYPQGTSDYFEWEAGHRGVSRGRHDVKGAGSGYVDPDSKAYKQGARARRSSDQTASRIQPRIRSGGGGAPFTTTIPESLQVALARAQYRGDKAAERRDLEREQAFLEAELKKAQRAHNKQEELEALQALQSVKDELSSLTTAKTRATGSRHAAGDTSREAALDARVTAAQSAEKTARTVKQEQAAFEREKRARTLLLALYEREAHDKSLTRSQRATALRKAAAERKQLAALEDKSVQDELAFAVLRAKNAVAAATVGSKAYDEAIAAEERALEREIAYDTARANNAKLSLASRKRALEEELAARKQLASLDKQKAGAAGAAGANEAQFLSTAAQLLGFAPNATPISPLGGKSETHLYELVQESRQMKHHLSQIRKATRFSSTAAAQDASLAVAG